MEFVVLVDEHNNVVGRTPKDEVHTKDTPLHRGFSVFLFNGKGDVLLTKRASGKKTFPGVWTNAVCGHPGPGESAVDAAIRRLKDELGIEDVHITEAAPYRYRFADKNGIVENEICPILIAYSAGDPRPNRDEVDDWKWMPWKEFLTELNNHPDIYSPWCKEEAATLTAKYFPLQTNLGAP